MVYSCPKERLKRPATFLISFLSAAPNTVPQLERCSMGQNFFQEKPKIVAFFYNTSMLGHQCSQDFRLGGGHKSRAMMLPEIFERILKVFFLWNKNIVDRKIRSRGQYVNT